MSVQLKYLSTKAKDQTHFMSTLCPLLSRPGGNVGCALAREVTSGLRFCLGHSVLLQILGCIFIDAFRY